MDKLKFENLMQLISWYQASQKLYFQRLNDLIDLLKQTIDNYPDKQFIHDLQHYIFMEMKKIEKN